MHSLIRTKLVLLLLCLGAVISACGGQATTGGDSTSSIGPTLVLGDGGDAPDWNGRLASWMDLTLSPIGGTAGYSLQVDSVEQNASWDRSEVFSAGGRCVLSSVSRLDLEDYLRGLGYSVPPVPGTTSSGLLEHLQSLIADILVPLFAASNGGIDPLRVLSFLDAQVARRTLTPVLLSRLEAPPRDASATWSFDVGDFRAEDLGSLSSMATPPLSWVYTIGMEAALGPVDTSVRGAGGLALSAGGTPPVPPSAPPPSPTPEPSPEPSLDAFLLLLVCSPN